MEYRKSKVGVYPVAYGWAYRVVGPSGTEVTAFGFSTEAAARAAGRRQARFYDKLERDRADGITTKRTDRVLERGVRTCQRCGKPHNLVATTRRGRRWGQTWESPDCGVYHPEPWEVLARRLLAGRAAAA